MMLVIIPVLLSVLALVTAEPDDPQGAPAVGGRWDQDDHWDAHEGPGGQELRQGYHDRNRHGVHDEDHLTGENWAAGGHQLWHDDQHQEDAEVDKKAYKFKYNKKSKAARQERRPVPIVKPAELEDYPREWDHQYEQWGGKSWGTHRGGSDVENNQEVNWPTHPEDTKVQNIKIVGTEGDQHWQPDQHHQLDPRIMRYQGKATRARRSADEPAAHGGTADAWREYQQQQQQQRQAYVPPVVPRPDLPPMSRANTLGSTKKSKMQNTQTKPPPTNLPKKSKTRRSTVEREDYEACYKAGYSQGFQAGLLKAQQRS